MVSTTIPTINDVLIERLLADASKLLSVNTLVFSNRLFMVFGVQNR